MKVLICASEGVPYAKTGGLADVVGALPKALAKKGVDVRVIMPFYKKLKDKNTSYYVGNCSVTIGQYPEYVGIFKEEADGITYYFIDNNKYFYRDNLYGYQDDGERFAYFDFAVLEALKVVDFFPDIIHINDWQTGLVPYIIHANYYNDNRISRIKTVFSIHNMQYQGNFSMRLLDILFLPYSSSLEFGGDINFMKSAIMESDSITTVSPTYKDEVLTTEYGYSLQSVLGMRYYDFMGILNGIDTEKFNPETDKIIAKKYNSKNFTTGKKECKKALLKEFGLEGVDKPLFGMVTRLVNQKGIELLMPIMDEVINYSDANFILMGSGNPEYENFFRSLEARYPNRFKAYVGYSDEVATRIYAGSDIFLMPSKFEPCGLGQMIAMRYGSLPLVRETGGLKDSVFAYNKYTGEGTGFTFTNFKSFDLKEVMFLAINIYENDKTAWKKLVENAMNMDYSWDKSAQKYLDLYNSLTYR